MTAANQPRLVPAEGGAGVPLTGRLMTVGSAAGCGLRLAGRKAPALAGHLLFKEGAYHLHDLSGGGQFRVNGEILRGPRPLVDGDALELAGAAFTYREGPDAGALAAAGALSAGPLEGLIESVVGLLEQRGPDIFPALVASVSRLLRCDAARVVEEDADGESRTLARYPAGAALDRFSKRAIEWARESRRAVLMQESDWEGGYSIESLRKNAVGAIICTALREGDAILGYLYMDRLGGSDPFTEPDRAFAESLGRLFGAILSQRRALARQQEAIARLQDAPAGEAAGIVHESPAMAAALELAGKMARTGGNVLIRGETGTGKEMVARYVHARSPRSAKPFLALNCGAIPESLMESELFGHEKGSFTGADRRKIGLFEAADGGTVFLDEIGDLPLALQVKLLRVLQEGEVSRIGNPNPVKVDVRVVSATHRDLSAEAEAGRFRQDLYFRLAVLDLYLPPLRERGQDVVLLAEFLLRKYLARSGQPPRSLSQAARNRLLEYAFPGNVRELENVIQKALLLSDGPSIRPEDLQWAGPAADARKSGALATLKEARARAEKEAMAAALERASGNVSLAAKLLDVDRKWLMKLMEEGGLDADAYRKA